jgi:hypothetical protein
MFLYFLKVHKSVVEFLKNYVALGPQVEDFPCIFACYRNIGIDLDSVIVGSDMKHHVSSNDMDGCLGGFELDEFLHVIESTVAVPHDLKHFSSVEVGFSQFFVQVDCD